MSQIPRPRSVTIIGWYLLLSGAYTTIYFGLNYKLFDEPLMRKMMEASPLPAEVQIGQIFAGGAIAVITGLAMLKGQNWGRWLYVIWLAVGLIAGLFTSPMKVLLLPSLLVLIAFSFFMFRPKANAFFGQPRGEQFGEDNETSL